MEDIPPKPDILAPYPLAMIVCDAVYRDPTSGKIFILGCFSAISARTFPFVHPLMTVFISLTDGHGKSKLILRLIDAEEQNDPIFETSAEVSFPDPRAVLETTIAAVNTVFPAPGEYRLQLFAGTQPVIERRIICVQMPEVKP